MLDTHENFIYDTKMNDNDTIAHDNSETLEQRILRHYDSLPRAERKLADLILGKGIGIQYLKAQDLAKEAVVSKATTVRFFNRLGYENYRDARNAAQKSSIKLSVNEVPRQDETNPIGQDLHLSTEIQNLRHTYESLSKEKMTACIMAMTNAQKLWVVGFDDDFALAHYARALLIKVKPDIRFLPLSGFSVPEEFASITPRDVILGFGIRRRPPALKRILASGIESGAKVFLICNEHTEEQQPITYLKCRTRGASLFDSITAPMSVIGHLCAGVAATLGDPAIDRMHRIESLYAEWDEASIIRTI